MSDGFRNYDRWKLASPDDEADNRDDEQLRNERAADRADVMRDRKKDERPKQAKTLGACTDH